MNKSLFRKERIIQLVELFNRLSPDDHLNRAILLATLVHAEDKDKAGKPYIEHVMRVITGCQTFEGKVVAGIHDVCEDHPEFTFKDLLDMGFTEYQVKGVENITKKKGEPKEIYYNRVMQAENSIDAKLSDLRDNSRLDRLDVVTEEDRKRTEEYVQAIELIQSFVRDKQ